MHLPATKHDPMGGSMTCAWPWSRPVLAALVLLSASLPGVARPRPCPPSPQTITRIAPEVWLIAGQAGDSDADNHGRISNLLAVRDGRRLWLLGSGPDADTARALDCQLARLTGRRVSDVIAPWPRPELVLGQTGLPRARHWAHEAVADAMARRCPQCIERLAQRLGRPAPSTREPPVPERRLQGRSGRLGPWRWWRLQRADDTAVTVWVLPRQGVAAAHGLLWSDGAPDLRDAHIGSMRQSLQALQALAAPPGRVTRWLPEQGELLGPEGPALHLAYLDELERQADQAMEDGSRESDMPPPPSDPRFAAGPRHALNWQHAWREAEARWFAASPTPGR
ncbi:MAG: hypothetical protein RLZZ592_1908 [Pseudomonadota bacterium]|jgi:hypothetical protein